MYSKIKYEAKILAASAFIGVVIALAIGTFVYADRVQREIADNVIRFHVLASSASAEDIALKESVRDRILFEFEDELSRVGELNTAREAISANLTNIQAIAEEVVKEKGFTHTVQTSLSQVFFPTREYGDKIFPPGWYESLQVVIGNGAGGNWWCLMFPPLCFVDMTTTSDTARLLEETVPPEGFRLLAHGTEDNRGVEVRFRVVEWWQNRRAPMPESESPYDSEIQMARQ